MAIFDRYHVPRFILIGLIGLFVLVLIRTAWVCDDAYISFTCAANLLSGEGLTYQPGERVQAFSNPLWTLLCGALALLTGEFWVTSMLLGMVLSLLALLTVVRHVGHSWQACALILAALGASAYVDFSTSGLENSLSFLLVVLFAQQALRPQRDRKWLLSLFFWAGLAIWNRLDLVLVVAPVCAWALLQAQVRFRLGWALLALLPVVVWEGFAFWYYGSLLPNTWLAKLGSGDGRGFLLLQGLTYLWDTLRHDPVTLLVPLGAAGLAVWRGAVQHRLLLLGIVAYGAAVLLAGGDFMRGRMFAVPFVLGLFLLGRIPWPAKWAPVALAVFLVLAVWRSSSPVWSGADYHVGRSENAEMMYPDNITDERAMYFARTGWWVDHGQEEHPMRLLERKAKANRGLRKSWQGKWKVRVIGAAGFVGYEAQPGVWLVDQLGLADPVLARLPGIKTAWWRAGHYPRMLPDGYLESLETGALHLADEALQNYVEHLWTVIRSDLGKKGRLATASKLQLGRYDSLLDFGRYRTAYKLVQATSLDWHYLQHWRPVRWTWEQVQNRSSVRFAVKGDVRFRMEVYRGDFCYGHQHLEVPSKGLAKYEVALPPQIVEGGWDEIWLWPEGGGYQYEFKPH